MKHFYLLLKAFACCAAFMFINETIQAQQLQTKTSSAKQDQNNNYAFRIIDAGNKTFGYDIYQNSRLIIHQPSIPAFSGNKGFKTKTGAERVAQLVISKIKKGEMPPTVTVREIKMLKAL